MAITDAIINYRRFLKRRNYSSYTVRNYMSTVLHFVRWVHVPIEQATHHTMVSFIDHLLERRLQPKTINCYLDSIRSFYDYLISEEDVDIANPVKPCGFLSLCPDISGMRRSPGFLPSAPIAGTERCSC
jgi:site-specific recombinase XerD